MKDVVQIFREQLTHVHLIFRLATYDIKSMYQMHYLGVLWQLLNPILQIFAFWFVFGIGIRHGAPMGEVPYFIWLMVGLIPWFFISASIIHGSNSVYTKVNLVSKMKFPVSVLPTIAIVKNGYNFIVLMVVLGVILLLSGINPGIHIVQLVYYLFALFFFLFSLTLLCSTFAVLTRDFQTGLTSLMRLLFFLTPIFWDASNLTSHLLALLRLNPLYYLIEGFRNTLLMGVWFYEDFILTIYFWSFTLLILFVGAYMHMKFRNKFVDYL